MSEIKEQVQEALKSQLGDLNKQINSNIEKANLEAANKMDAKLKEETKILLDKHQEASKALADRADTLEAAIEKMKKEGNPLTPKTLESELKNSITADFVAKLQDRRNGKFDLDFHSTKAVATMTTAASLTGEVIPVQYAAPVFTLRNQRHDSCLASIRINHKRQQSEYQRNWRRRCWFQQLQKVQQNQN